MKIFSNDQEGFFISCPNRFIVTAKTETGIIRAHCPNPGRLQEILLPGQKLITPVLLQGRSCFKQPVPGGASPLQT
ncbi:MAG: hypothetical protein DRP59_02735 [Spirochaetes bacterium]|nr:MAG: hypothetical protein DRP59_02735 [Spirochaetota bacterium]